MNKSQVDRINLDGELGIVNSAKVSFNSWSETLTEKGKNLIRFLKEHKHGSPFYHLQKMFSIDNFDLSKFDKLDIAGLEWYVAEGGTIYIVRASYFSYCQHKEYFDKYHTLEYEEVCNEEWLLKRDDLYKASRIPYLSFRIKAPIFVVRQLETHSVGFAKNEVSGRYVKFNCEFFKPDKWRKKSPSNKQGSLQDKFVNQVEILLKGLIHKETLNLKQKFILFCLKILQKDLYVRLFYEKILEMQEKWYHANIENGMCGEQARMLLPLATYTHFVWTGSLQDYARICYFRLKPDAQLETREVVEQIYKLCKAEYPNTFDRLIELVGDRMKKSFKNL